jgi:hypothetical protein
LPFGGELSENDLVGGWGPHNYNITTRTMVYDIYIYLLMGFNHEFMDLMGFNHEFMDLMGFNHDFHGDLPLMVDLPMSLSGWW